MKTRNSPSCGCCGEADDCFCPSLPDEVLVSTGVITPWENDTLNTPFNRDNNGNPIVWWTGCSQLPSSFVLSRISIPTDPIWDIYEAAWRWQGPSSTFWTNLVAGDNTEQGQVSCKLTAGLWLRNDLSDADGRCSADFWLGIVRSSFITTGIMALEDPDGGEGDIGDFRSIFDLRGVSGTRIFRPSVQVIGLTEGDFHSSFQCGRGTARWFAGSWYGMTKFSLPNGIATPVMLESDYLPSDYLIPPFCLGVDTKTITFEPL